MATQTHKITLTNAIEFKSRYIVVQKELGDCGWSYVGLRFLGQFDQEKDMKATLIKFRKENSGRTTHYLDSVGYDREAGKAYEAQYYSPKKMKGTGCKPGWYLSEDEFESENFDEAEILRRVNEYADKYGA